MAGKIGGGWGGGTLRHFFFRSAISVESRASPKRGGGGGGVILLRSVKTPHEGGPGVTLEGDRGGSCHEGGPPHEQVSRTELCCSKRVQ